MKSFLFSTLLLLAGLNALSAQNGTIRGTLSDANSGEVLMFANVVVPGSDPIIGTQTDLDGNYELNVPAGTFSLEFSYIGYTETTITGIEVKSGEVTVLDVLLDEASEVLEEVVVSAARIDRTENALLALQRKASTIQDGISAQEISRFGSNNAAESMKRVTGASVVDGKYIFVRGLGDRYSSAQLNGINLPSTDPYRNSTQLDLIPANLLDNIIASKSFTPDQPGSFTGGNVNMQTKSFPDRFTVSASISASYNDQASFNNNYLTYEGGSTDWLGYDDGSRDIPAYLNDPETRALLTRSLNIRARRDEELATVLDQSVKSLNNEMAPGASSNLMNHGVSFSIGNQYRVFGNQLGVLAGVNYRRAYQHYENGSFFGWDNPIRDMDGTVVINDNRLLSDTRSTENAQVGALFNLAYKFAGSQKVAFNFLYNHDGEKEARSLFGPFPAILSGGEFQSRSLSFKERGIISYQLTGEHLLSQKSGIKLEWGGSFVQTQQQEPDLRFFANSYIENSTDGTIDYLISPSEFDLPFRFFRDLTDQQFLYKADLTIPFLQGQSKGNKIQIGGLYQNKDRDFTESRFQYQNKSRDAETYQGDPAAFFANSNLGIIDFDSTRNQYKFGLFLTDETIPTNTYTGSEAVTAAYGMVTYDFRKFRLVAGARVEQTDINVASADTTQATGAIEATDVLPSLNLIYRLNEQVNVRASFNQTLARPNMREMAPFSSFEFIGDFILTGNPELKRTLVDNYDIRLEWFPNSGELLAVSGYYKKFQDPISTAFLTAAANTELTWFNLPEATVFGVEFEVRKSLGFLTDRLNDFKVFTNLSLIHSESPIPEDELELIRQQNPEKGDTRPFPGQSPYLFNGGLNYNNLDNGWDVTVALNIFGERLAVLNEGGLPDFYEQPRPQLDLNVQKAINERIKMKISLNNLLNPDYKTSFNFNGEEYLFRNYTRGRTYGFSLTYSI